MMTMNYLIGFVLVFVVISVASLGVAVAPYQGVISLMGASFFCCLFMVLLGRTYVALVMYIVYLGGLIVVFGYCVSVEKDKGDILQFGGLKYIAILVVVGMVCLWDAVGGTLTCFGWEEVLCLEVNGVGVFYCVGGVGLMVCSWGLLVVLFSVLVVLGWSRLGGLRPF